MPVIDEILEGQIIDEYRDLAEHKKPTTEGTDVDPCTSPEACSLSGCESGNTGDCCTDDKKKKKKEYEQRAAGWFDPPVAHL